MRLVQEALTFDDVLLLPAHSTVLPKDVSLKTQVTREIALNIPLVSSAMDTVTEAPLAIAIAQDGGIGVIHRNMSIERQAHEVHKVKKFESGMVKNPITIHPDATIAELLQLTQQHHISGVPVVDGELLVGIVTSRDLRFATDYQQPVSQLMTQKDKLITVKEGTTQAEIIHIFHQHRIEKILVVNDQFQLRGMVTVKDIQKTKEKPDACKDDQGRLRVAAAVGTGPQTEERVSALVSAGVDILVVDTAHGHAQSVLDKLKWIRKTYPDLQIIGGNIATADAALALKAVGVDAVKVGIGPGSICTTRIVTGVGVPQISAIANVSQALKNSNIPVIADGGIRYSGDIGKAIAAGAWAIMIGGLFAGTEESPGEVELYQGRSYKSYRGMGSLAAMAAGASDRYFQDHRDNTKLVPEGIEGRVAYKGKIASVVHQLLGGLRATMGYVGCHDIPTLRNKAEFIKITAAAMRESHVHNVNITKEAPNYHVEEN